MLVPCHASHTLELHRCLEKELKNIRSFTLVLRTSFARRGKLSTPQGGLLPLYSKLFPSCVLFQQTDSNTWGNEPHQPRPTTRTRIRGRNMHALNSLLQVPKCCFIDGRFDYVFSMENHLTNRQGVLLAIFSIEYLCFQQRLLLKQTLGK